MSMIILSILAAATTPVVDSAAPTYWRRVAAEARIMGVEASTLHRAINAPVATHRYRGVTRYCYKLDRIDPGSQEQVCRSRSDWLALGLDPIGRES